MVQIISIFSKITDSGCFGVLAGRYKEVAFSHFKSWQTMVFGLGEYFSGVARQRGPFSFLPCFFDKT
jgi:hypothetical protein